MPDLLFQQGFLSDVLRNQDAQVARAAEALSDEAVSAESIQALTERLVGRYRIEPLAIAWEQKRASIEDRTIELGDGWSSRPVTMPGTRLTFRVPFTGERDLFKYCPSQFTSNPPRAEVRGTELVLAATMPASERESLKAQLEAEIAKVQRWVDFSNADVAPFNERLPRVAREAIERRRAKVVADQEFLASLGVPVDEVDAGPETYAVEVLERNAPVAEPPPSRMPRAPEPVLADSNYEAILATCRAMGHSLERNPKGFVGLGEEGLRDHFLGGLNARYPGGASGETFNSSGKTDILVRLGDRILFVAEAKIWDGPASLTKALGQILAYTTWRDTKTAVLVFNRDRQMSTVLSGIVPSVQALQADARKIDYGHQGEFRFELDQRNDPNLKLLVTIQLFDLPEAW